MPIKKKTVALVTILDNQNIGTYLQALALSEVIKRENGQEILIVNYIREHTRPKAVIRRIFSQNKNPLFGLISTAYRLAVPELAKKKLKSFLANRVSLTQPYYSFNQLKESPPDADIFLTGSDQVWNSKYNKGIDEAFYLNFAPSKGVRYAYAASIGMDQFPYSELTKTKSLLKMYSKIAVREDSAVSLLEAIGIHDVEHVLDPTLLFNKADWMNVAKNDSFRKTEPYVLIYSVEKKRKDIILEVARQIAKEKRLKIYSVTPEWIREKFQCDKNFYFASPEKFLNLFLQADYTVVSSFHGTAFSINLNKNFVSVSPDKFNSRVNSLLQLTGIKDRLVTGKESDLGRIVKKSINYQKVNAILDRQRQKSINFIKQIHE